jgi:N-acetylmuramoyl-L-alanine amidase
MKPKRIFVDPGHGNSDPGAVHGSRREADDNLRLALSVETLLRARGFETGMTRTSNDFKTSRVTAAVQFGADLYLSLHRNDDEKKQGIGYETVTKIGFSKADNALSEAIHKRMVEVGVQRDREIKRINLQTLTALPAKTAACTLEVGFIHNTRDNQLFDENLQAYAQAIVQGVIDIYGAPFPALTSQDAIAVLRAEAGLEKLLPKQAARLDINRDGRVTSADALAILQIVAGLPAALK